MPTTATRRKVGRDSAAQAVVRALADLGPKNRRAYDHVENLRDARSWVECAREASRLCREGDAAQHRRDMSALYLRRNHDVEPVDLWKHTMGISRGMLVRITNSAPAALPALDYVDVSDRDALLESCRADSDLVRLGKAVLPLRDESIGMLLTGYQDAPMMTNAEIARLTELSTPRIAQMRGALTRRGL